MRIVFKITKNENEVNIEPLFAWNDSSYENVSLEAIIETLNDVSDKNVSFISRYAGNYKFKDCSRKEIEILVKLVNNKVDEILKTGEKYSYFDEIAKLLNKEVKDENVFYEAYRVRGELK